MTRIKRAVLTGATGVVGTALIEELLRKDIEVLAILRRGSPNNGRLPKDPRLTVRECSLESLASMINDTGKSWDVFFHLGWTGTKGKERFDLRIHHRNIAYALDAVDLAERLGCDLFIGAGSQAEYGRTKERLRPELAAFPENAYGIAKLCAGQMTREYAHERGLRQIWTRILSVYGPNDGERTLITSLIRTLQSGGRPSCTKGEQIWDFLAASDAARALRLIAERGRDGAVYLIASGRERTLRSYIEELRDVVAPGAEIGFGDLPYLERQVMHLTADISATTRDTGWVPELPFAEGVRRMAEAGSD